MTKHPMHLAGVNLLVLSALAVPSVAQAPLFTDVQRTWVNYETTAIAPIYVDGNAETGKLVTINQPGLRIIVVDLGTGAQTEIPAGPGLVSVVARPHSSEVWAVDRITHTVSVVDLTREAIVRTIAMQGREPHGLVFDPEGDMAFVSCSASNSVDVIDCGTYAVSQSIDLPLLHPRGIAYVPGLNDAPDRVWVAPFHSGNNTATATRTTGPILEPRIHVDDIVDLQAEPGVNQLPDRDLVAIAFDAGQGAFAFDDSLTVKGVGAMLLNAHHRPGTMEVWVPNTEALNTTFGEVNFVQGQVVRNQVTIIDTANSTVTAIVDLDATSGGTETCAQPMSIAFAADGSLAWVAGYGSDTVAVLNGSAPSAGWLGWYKIEGTPDPITDQITRSGPRGLAVDASGLRVFVYNKGDNSYTSFKSGPVQSGVTADAAVALGYDPTPLLVKRGRFHITSAENSGNGSSSCASCHIDGGADFMPWELSKWHDAEGTPKASLTHEEDRKGPMTTQSLRALEETAPFHWRGEQRDLGAFNAAFANLLERPGGELPDEEFLELEEYVFSLVYPANPRQPLGRDHVGPAAAGRDKFTGGACVGCHITPLGSNNEIQRVLPISSGTSPAFLRNHAPTVVVPQLRGVSDKVGENFDVGGAVGFRTEQGTGLFNNGSFGDVAHFIDSFFQAGLPTQQERDEVTAFLEQFDTGLAPSTAWQRTFRGMDHTAPASFPELTTMLVHTDAGKNDLVAYLWFPSSGGNQHVQMAYDRAAQVLRLPNVGVTLPVQDALDFTANVNGILTFVGVPLGMGNRWGVDRDGDYLLDADEPSYGTDPLDADTDDDGFPDGYEIWQNMNPLVQETSSPDSNDPGLSGAITVDFANITTAKLVFSADEPVRARILRGGTPVSRWSPAEGFEYDHSMIVQGLDWQANPNNHTLELIDPAGNSDTFPFTVTTSTKNQAYFTVRSITGLPAQSPAGMLRVQIEVLAFEGSVLPNALDVEVFASYEDPSTPLTLITNDLDFTASGQFLTVDLPLPVAGPVGQRTVHFGVREIRETGLEDSVFYMDALDVLSHKSIVF